MTLPFLEVPSSVLVRPLALCCLEAVLRRFILRDRRAKLVLVCSEKGRREVGGTGRNRRERERRPGTFK
jgi:hypothetical protein